jgi:fructose-bisphosphate aldolase class 1
MYKNPLNNGNISDNNSLKKQRDYGSIIKKYENKKLQTEPTELQKYYQYLTYQQPILDELNYVAERMRNEDIKTKTDDYNFIEDLKIKREKNMKEISQSEKSIKENRESLFNYSSTVKQDDKTPVINTDVEMEYQTEPQPQPQIIKNTPIIQSLMGDLFGSEYNLSNADTEPIKEEKFELSREEEKMTKSKKKREGRKKKIKI